jgi:hypothetical protein
MEAKLNSKIRFFLEPTKLIKLDSDRNPKERKNLQYLRIYKKVLSRVLFIALSIPIILFFSFTNNSIEIFYSIVPLLLGMSVTIFDQKSISNSKEPSQSFKKVD